jgi:ubiquinone biosynthesis protein
LSSIGIQRRLKGIARFRQIAFVLAKYGFGEVLSRLGISLRLTSFFRKRVRPDASGPERLIMVLEELGPTFIKFGQTLSTRSYLLPPEYRPALARLQDRVSPFPYEEVRRIIRDELGAEPEEVFRDFERVPFASASIAQVHRARLPSGEDICVKVQRPGVRRKLDLDILILHEIARLLEASIPESRQYDPTGIVAEFERPSRRETDFTSEAAFLAIFRTNFENVEEVCIPRVYRDLSTSCVLTTEYVDGIKISHVEELKAVDLDLPQIARVGAGAVLKQVFEDGLFHADPHPGNLFVLTDGRIAPVDFGIVGRLTAGEIDSLADLLISVVHRDGEKLVTVLEGLDVLPPDVRRRDVLDDAMLFIDKYASQDLGKIDLKEAFEDFLSLLRRYRIKLRTEFLLLGKALGTYEDVGRTLDPGFNIMEEAEPYVRKLLRRKYSIFPLLKGGNLMDSWARLSSIPGDLASIVSQAKEGQLKIEFEHVGLDEVTQEIKRSSNRLSFSLIVAALVVASSLVLFLGAEAAEYRMFGIAGFVFAAIVGAWLLINILRSGRV